jgi:hypothetical protein
MQPYQIIGAGPGTPGPRVKIERDAGTAGPASLGAAGHVGVYRWGPTGPLVHTKKSDLQRWRGGPMVEDVTYQSGQDFYDEAEQGGTLITLRVSGSSAAKAKLGAYARDISADYGYKSPDLAPTHLFDLEGAYVGRRGGRLRKLGGVGASSFSVGSETFATGTAIAVNAWAGALLYFKDPSPDNTARGPFTVLSNNAAGLLTLDLPVGTTAPASGASWWLLLSNVNEAGLADGFAASFGSGARLPGTEFSMALSADGEEARSTGNASVSADVDTYIQKILADELRSRAQLMVTATMDDAVVADDQMRPANWVGRVAATRQQAGSVIGNVLVVDTTFWARTAGSGNSYCQQDLTVYGSAPIRCKAVVTFTDGDGNFTVEYQTWEGDLISTGLAAGAASTLYDPRVPFLPAFMVRETTAILNDELTIWFNPLPPDLRSKGGFLYTHATLQGGSPDLRKRYRIIGNTVSSITVTTGSDLGGDDSVVASVPPTATAPDPGPYTLVTGTETFVYNINGAGDVTLTLSESSGSITTTALATALNALETAARPAEQRVHFYPDDDDALAAYTLRDVGADATFVLDATGTLLPILGWAASDQTIDGGKADATLVAVQYRQDLYGGIDDVGALTSDDYIDTAWDIETSPLHDLDRVNLGGIDWTCPGVGTPAVQTAAEVLCHSKAWTYFGDIDPSVAADEAAVRTWLTDNFTPLGSIHFMWDTDLLPRRGIVPGVVTPRTSVGAAQGAYARIARDWNGLHKAPAGVTATIDKNFSRLASADDATDPRPKDSKILGDIGVVPVEQLGGRIFMNGDRMPGAAWAGVQWLHKVRVTYQLARELLFAGIPYVFDPIDENLFGQLEREIRDIFFPRFVAGWFIVPPGASFSDVIEIRSDAELNPQEQTALGRAVASVRILTGIKDTAENPEFILGPGGLSVRQG